MSPEQNKAIVRRLFEEVFDQRNLAAADEIISPGYIDHAAWPGQAPGREGWKQRYASFLDLSHDGKHTIDQMIAEGDKVAVRVTGFGTHTGRGEFKDVPPTGNQIRFGGIGIYRIENGMIAEHWNVVDMLTALQQLGVVPGPK